MLNTRRVKVLVIFAAMFGALSIAAWIVEQVEQVAQPGEFSIGHLASSRTEVDALLGRAQAAGALVSVPPHDRPWGIYSGYFRDPDGHLWEIIWNPRMTPSP